jgi:hypothetical protein
MSNARVTRNQRGSLPRRRDIEGDAIDNLYAQHPAGKNAPEERHKARLTVVWLAEDADDARDLLDKLGLL